MSPGRLTVGLAAPAQCTRGRSTRSRAAVRGASSHRLFFAVGALLLAATPIRADEPRPDSTLVHFELGAATDFTNEQFYEDAFVDTISLGRRLVSTPESRVAGVFLAGFSGTRGAQRASWSVQNELSLGNRLQRDALGASWRSTGPDWKLHITPRVEFRHDETFGRQLEEWRGATNARLRRILGDGSSAVDAGLSADLLRTSGAGAEFLPDRNTARLSLGYEQSPLLGSEWRVSLALTGRQFPDSTIRDHLEHGWEARWSRPFEGGHVLVIETHGARRRTIRPAATSRDRFWEADAAGEIDVRLGEAVAVRARSELETMDYDVEDSTAFFDYRILRVRLAPRLERGAWNVGLGPRAETLLSPSAESEEYREIGGYSELEVFGGGAWWSAVPAAGWREYTGKPSGDPFAITALHSSYAFYELTMMADQPLGAGMRLRLSGTGRYEAHVDAAQDARSLYFSLDVRRLF